MPARSRDNYSCGRRYAWMTRPPRYRGPLGRASRSPFCGSQGRMAEVDWKKAKGFFHAVLDVCRYSLELLLEGVGTDDPHEPGVFNQLLHALKQAAHSANARYMSTARRPALQEATIKHSPLMATETGRRCGNEIRGEALRSLDHPLPSESSYALARHRSWRFCVPERLTRPAAPR
jgi:hypothetical protein